jgi:hypothetical protein
MLFALHSLRAWSGPPSASCREQIGRLNQSCENERNVPSSAEAYQMRSGLSKGHLYQRSLVALTTNTILKRRRWDPVKAALAGPLDHLLQQ